MPYADAIVVVSAAAVVAVVVVIVPSHFLIQLKRNAGCS